MQSQFLSRFKLNNSKTRKKKKGQKITDFKLEKTESTIFGKQEAAYVEMAENYQIFTINIAELLSSLRKHSEALPLNFPCL